MRDRSDTTQDRPFSTSHPLRFSHVPFMIVHTQMKHPYTKRIADSSLIDQPAASVESHHVRNRTDTTQDRPFSTSHPLRLSHVPFMIVAAQMKHSVH